MSASSDHPVSKDPGREHSPDRSNESAHVERTFVVRNRRGLHARAAALLVQTASQFQAEVVVEKDDQRANAKSVMGVLLLCGAQGTSIRVQATGVDAAAAVDSIEHLFANRFHETD